MVLEAVQIKPAKPALASVIWLHGLGADGHDFADIVPALNLPDELPIRFIFPHAPIRPVTINALFAMRAWYDIYSLSHLEKEDEEGIRETEHFIHDLIEEELKHVSSAQRIFLAGFSQGGAMALFTGLRYPQRLGGIIALSTYLPLLSTIQKELHISQHELPIFMAHGTEDHVLPLELGEKTLHALQTLKLPIEWHTYPMAHQVCNAEIQDIAKWLLVNGTR